VPAALGAVVGALMVRTWVRNRDWHDNFTLAQATLATNPDSPEFNLVMGGWYRERGDNAHARQYYLRALRSMPEKSAYFNLGNIELDERRYPMAVTYYNHALEHSPEDPEVLNNLGVALRDSGHAAEAATAWERVVELKPAHPGAYINLLAVYLKLQDRERGAKLAERALKRFPRNADICWNAAQLYNLLGHTEKAKVLQDRVAEIEGKPGAGQPR